MPVNIYGSESDVYTVGSQQLHTVGQRMMTPDGSVFRYGEMGATVGVANKLYQSSAVVAHWLTQALATAMAVGDATITQKDGGTAFVVDQMARNTILVEETADLGHIYRVKSNAATATNETVCTLENGVTVKVAVAVAAGNVTSALLNPWKDVIIQPATTLTGMIIGVPRVIIAINGYGWIQTRGPASCLIDASTAILTGNAVRASEVTAGAVALRDETAAYIDWADAGYCMETAPDADFGHVFLTIE